MNLHVKIDTLSIEGANLHGKIRTLSFTLLRYRLKYCLKGPLSPKQPTNQRSIEYSSTTTIVQIIAGDGRVVRWCWVNFQCRGVLLIWIRVGQGPTALAVGAGWGLFGHFFSPLSFLSTCSLSLGDSPI